MTAVEICEKVCGKIVCAGESGADPQSVYCGDFLSRVMGKAPANSIWVTVMANVNVAGVASLADIKVIVLCEGALPDKLLEQKCADENICLITTDLPAYDCCRRL